MILDNQSDLYAASKNLSGYLPNIENDFFKANTIWCRVACEQFENMLAPMIRHSFYELHYVFYGKVIITTNEDTFVIDESNPMLIVPPETFHTTEYVEKGTQKFVFAFSLNFNDETPKYQPFETVQRHQISEIDRYILTMLEYAAEPCPFSEIMIKNMAEAVLLCILRTCAPNIFETPEKPKKVERDVRFDEIKKFISDNIAFGITINDVAEGTRISVRQLNRLSHRVAGCPLGTLISRERLEYIKSLLQTDRTMKDIVEESGFSSQYSLNRFFKKYEDMSATEWRRSIRK